MSSLVNHKTRLVTTEAYILTLPIFCSRRFTTFKKYLTFITEIEITTLFSEVGGRTQNIHVVTEQVVDIVISFVNIDNIDIDG